MKLLEGKTALITGGSRGIGKAIALGFAAQGCNVAFTDLVIDENAQAVVKELEGFGVKAKGYASDASSFTSSHEAVEAILADFGTIDVLINNAGITKDSLLMRMTEQQWDAVINVNLKSAFNLTKAVQPIMLKNRKGSIINVSSVVGIGGNAGQANYSASKAGMIGFTKSIAKELGSRNIRCNAIAPGFIMTEMTSKLSEAVIEDWKKRVPLNRPGTPEDVANVCVFLGSELSDYVTGQVIPICGGLEM